MYTQKLETERHTMEQLANQHKLIKEKILTQRKQMGGINAAKENQSMVTKQVKLPAFRRRWRGDVGQASPAAPSPTAPAADSRIRPVATCRFASWRTGWTRRW